MDDIKVIPIREEIIKFCKNIGFDYMGGNHLAKVTTSNTTGGGVQMGSYPYPRNGILKLDYEFILVFKNWVMPSSRQKNKPKMGTPKNGTLILQLEFCQTGAEQNNHIAMFPF